MKARLLRVVVSLVLIAIACVPMFPVRGLGTATLTGQSLTECIDLFDPTCATAPEVIYLSGIVYEAAAASANTVTFAYVPGVNNTVCGGETGPGSCGEVGTGPDRFVFTEVFAGITAAGLCTVTATRVGSCSAPFYANGLDEFWPNAVESLPVVISTKALNDQVTAVIDGLTSPEFAFSIDTGPGQDVVTLVDNSGHNFGGADQISCGAGTDRVITNSDVSVAPDCENVTRLT